MKSNLRTISRVFGACFSTVVRTASAGVPSSLKPKPAYVPSGESKVDQMIAMLNARRPETAITLWKSALREGKQPTIPQSILLLRAFKRVVHPGAPAVALELTNILESKNVRSPKNTLALAQVFLANFCMAEGVMYVKAVEEMVKEKQDYALVEQAYMHLIKAYGSSRKAEQMKAAMETLRTNTKIPLSEHVHATYIRALKNLGLADEIDAYFTQLKQDPSVRLSDKTYSAVISSVRVGSSAKLLEYFTEMKEAGIKPTYDIYSNVLLGICLKSDLDMSHAEKILDEMRESLVSISEELHGFMYTGYAKREKPEQALRYLESALSFYGLSVKDITPALFSRTGTSQKLVLNSCIVGPLLHRLDSTGDMETMAALDAFLVQTKTQKSLAVFKQLMISYLKHGQIDLRRKQLLEYMRADYCIARAKTMADGVKAMAIPLPSVITAASMDEMEELLVAYRQFNKKTNMKSFFLGVADACMTKYAEMGEYGKMIKMWQEMHSLNYSPNRPINEKALALTSMIANLDAANIRGLDDADKASIGLATEVIMNHELKLKSSSAIKL